MKRVLILVSALLALIVTLAACGGETVTVVVTATPETPQTAAPRELTALVGSGRDTEAIIAFLPSMLTVRAGDTITWKLDSDEIHTVSFLSGADLPGFAIPVPGGGPTDLMLNPAVAFGTRVPGAPVEVYSGTGMVNSGTMSDVPPAPDAPANNAFSLVFDTPGTYKFVCLIHTFMRGQVQVLAATAPDVPSQTQIDAQGQKQLAPLLVELEGLKARRDSGMAMSSEPGPNGTTTWFINAGGRGSERSVELLDFLPKDITIAEGDTVVWTSPAFHNVTFHPGRMHPEFVIPTPQEQGPPQLRLNPEVVFPSKPTGEFDGTGFFSSGIIGLDSPSGATSFSMTFSKAGSYGYMCAIHRELGMKGNITVVTRDQAGGLSNTIAFQDFGWDPNLTGATGSVTYRPVAGSFIANVSMADLMPDHTYNIYLMWNDLTGATVLDSTSWPFTTDAEGSATINVSKKLSVAEGAPLPALQVHFLVVDQNEAMEEPLLNPLGVAHPIALACSFPLGFLQLTAPGLPTPALTGDSVPLFNYGWAPGFEGGSGSISYDGQNPSFEGTVEVADLAPDFVYTLFVMSSALNGDQTTMEIVFTTDSSGAATVDISHTFDIPDGVPLPALQVHFLVLDKSVTLDEPANPLGIPNPIVLACLFPLGFLQF